MIARVCFLFLVLSVFCFPLLFPSSTNALGESKAYKERVDAVRRWAYAATTNLLTFSHDTYFDNIKANQHLMTGDGCRTYMKRMLDYEISDGVIERKDTLVTEEIWRNKVRTNILKVIDVDEEDENDYGAYTYKVEVPLIMRFENGLRKKRYRFIAVLEVLQLQPGKHEYKIDKWYAHNRRGAMLMSNYDSDRDEEDYYYCDILYGKDR